MEVQREVYAFKNISDLDCVSSSGGASWSFTKTFLSLYRENAYICGTRFDENMKLIFHITNRIDECEAFRGSKYIYANVGTVLHDIASLLSSGKYVLFVGSPCQVFATKMFCQKNNISQEHLLTIDLICNGAPAEEFWLKYVNWIEYKHQSQVANFRFRLNQDKTNPYQTSCSLKNGKILTDISDTASYNQLFLKKLSIRKNCFDCQFKKNERVGDITIGDFWGIDDLIPDFKADFGVSEILLNTPNGKRFFEKVQCILGKEIILQQYNSDDFLKYQLNLTGPTPIPDGYDNFWEDYNKYGMGYVLNRYADAGGLGGIRYLVKKFARWTGIKKIIKKQI